MDEARLARMRLPGGAGEAAGMNHRHLVMATGVVFGGASIAFILLSNFAWSLWYASCAILFILAGLLSRP